MRDAPLFTDLGGVPAGGRAVFVTASDGTKIRVAYWGGGDQTALLLPGRTEYIEKYGRMTQKLLDRGMNVVVIDLRGQGLSDRADGIATQGHVEEFLEYQQDVKAALAFPEIAALKGPLILFAHSMGGTIGLRAIIDGLEVKAAILSAPMWGIQNDTALRPLLGAATHIGKPFKIDKALAPGTKPTFYVLEQEFEGNNLTTDPEHFAMMKAQLRAHPELGLGGPTIRWASQAAKEMAFLRKVDVPDVPTLVLMGTNEGVIDAKAVLKRVPTLPNATLEIIEGGKHENWMETPDIQAKIWTLTDKFLNTL